jgi:hypothetical protein
MLTVTVTYTIVYWVSDQGSADSLLDEVLDLQQAFLSLQVTHYFAAVSSKLRLRSSC